MPTLTPNTQTHTAFLYTILYLFIIYFEYYYFFIIEYK